MVETGDRVCDRMERNRQNKKRFTYRKDKQKQAYGNTPKYFTLHGVEQYHISNRNNLI